MLKITIVTGVTLVSIIGNLTVSYAGCFTCLESLEDDDSDYSSEPIGEPTEDYQDPHRRGGGFRDNLGGDSNRHTWQPWEWQANRTNRLR
jgi:hypothetical protein